MGMDTILLATIADRISAIGSGLGGKKLKEDQLIAPSLTREGSEKAQRKAKKKQDLIAGLKKTHKR